ncbi:MAG: penicillin acylase family protein [Spirochaetes bacterium]|nr:penicillin acylase family protein [Spirochaetota bacterium]
MKKARIIGIILLILISAVFAFNVNIKRQFEKSVDGPTGTVVLPGISDRVVIRRDGLGVPYIEAQNEEDLFFAAGYVTASDRLWQMVSMKMAMQGRLSEIIGKDFLNVDYFMRTLGASAVVEETLRNLDARSLAVLRSFARGVNEYVKLHPDLPVEFYLSGYRPEPWQAGDSLYVFAMLSLSLSFNFIEELGFLNIAAKVGYEKAAYLMPVYPDEPIPFDEAKKLSEIKPDDLNRMTAGWGGLLEQLRGIMSINVPASNNWALSGARTKGGRPIVCNDTHLQLLMPNAWFIMHLNCPTYEAAGVTMPGIPIVSLGYNGRVAWGATMVMADNQDIFVEKMKTDKGGKQYLYKGQWLPVQTRTEEFKIRGGGAVMREVVATVHGPVLNDALAGLPFPPEMPVQPLPVTSEYGLALSWAMGDGSKTFSGFLDMGSVGTATEVRPALMGVDLIYLNIVYGDRESIGWQVTGKFPIRKKGTGQLPSPGWSGDYDWNGYVPAADNPHAENPEAGYIVTANNRTVDVTYPHHLTSSWYNPERAERIIQVLARTKNATAQEMMKLQFDRYSLMAKKAQDLLFRGESAKLIADAVNRLGEEPRENAREALEFLKPQKFNAVMDIASTPAAVMGAFMHAAVREIFLDELGPEGSLAWESFQDAAMMSYSAQQDHILGREDSPFWDNVATKEKETRWQILAESLSKAVMLCEERMGNNRKKWEWGRLHTYTWKHDVTRTLPLFHGYFNRGPYPAGGDGHTVNVATNSCGSDFDVEEIPAMRMVVDFGLSEPAFLIVPHGQSGNPASKHYDDMLDYWLNGRNHPLPFGKQAVEAQYADVLLLLPEGKK